MKIIHCADIHLGSPLKELDEHLRGQRREEIEHTFAHMVEWAQSNSVDAIIIAGDLFDSANVSPTVVKNFLKVVETNENIDFILDVGNHDNEVDFTKFYIPGNLKLFSSTDCYRYGQTAIYRAPSVRAIRNMKFDRMDTNIVVCHGAVEQSDLPAGHNIDYCALGHIHKYASIPIDERGMACYSGCLEARGFDESGRKGFVLLDINGNSMPKVKHTFIDAAARIVWDFAVDISGCKTNWDVYQNIIEITERAAKKDMVYVHFFGADNIEKKLDLNYLQEAAKGQFFALRLEKSKVEGEAKPVLRVDGRLRKEFEKCVREQDLSEDEIQDILAVGFAALDGEDILG